MIITNEKIAEENPVEIDEVSPGTRFEIRTRQGIKYRFDKETGLFENPSTGKWVHNPIKRSIQTVSTLRYYWHPDLAPILNDITQDPYMKECIGYLLKFILVKHQLKNHIKKHHKSTRRNKLNMTWISHDFAKRILGESKYQEILLKLVDNKILNKVVCKSAKGRIYLYSFENPAHLLGYSLVPVSFKSLEKKILNYRKWAKSQYHPLDQRVIDHVIKTGWEITITKEQLKTIWLARYESKYIPRHGDDAMLQSDYLESMDDVLKIIKHWNEADEHDKLDFFTVDDFGNRLHHIFTYLPSEIRAYVKNRNGKIMNFTQFDLANSQPAIFANMLVKNHGFKYSYSGSDFVSLVCRQRIYEDLAKKMGISRDNAKTELLHMLYCRNGGVAEEQFQKLYPDVARVAGDLKRVEKDEHDQFIPAGKRYKQLPQMMQRVESEMFRGIWQTLLNNGHDFLPIHDAVYVANLKPQQKRIVKSMIFGILKESFSIKIKVKPDDVHQKHLDKQISKNNSYYEINKLIMSCNAA